MEHVYPTHDSSLWIEGAPLGSTMTFFPAPSLTPPQGNGVSHLAGGFGRGTSSTAPASSSLFCMGCSSLPKSFQNLATPVSTITSLSQKIPYLYIEGRLLAAMFMKYNFTPWPSPPWIRPGNPDHTGSIRVSLDFGIMIQRQLILSVWN